MTIIDCAGDNEIALELEHYLTNLSLDATSEESKVHVDKINVVEILNFFLTETSRTNYKIRKINSTDFLLSKEVAIEDFGFLRCEMCGCALSNRDELMNHRRVHGIV
jgi:hypothetical protein